jgi:hypothetical protein
MKKSWSWTDQDFKTELRKYSRTHPTNSFPANETFAACLLIMDDNHRLTEWLAYHSHVLPMDYLVVAIDPGSRTSPSKILNEWRNHGMTIVEWDNNDIFQGRLEIYYRVILNRNRMPHDHRQRQNMFLRNCLVHMKEQNRTWVMLTDSDEYLGFNGKPGSRENYASIPYPSVKQHGAIINFLHDPRVRSLPRYQGPCIAIPRMLFGALNESSVEAQHKGVPQGINATRFDTLRYRKHIRRAVIHTHPINGWAKVIVDVSRVDWDELPTPHEAFKTNGWEITVHQPVPKVCPRPFVANTDSLLLINHYVGSWEAFSFREDRRASEGRDKQRWIDKARRTDFTDDDIRPWLSGFVEHHGPEKAATMLQLVGLFH